MSTIFSYIITIFCIFLPVYFWAYAIGFFSEKDNSIRLKFWMGVFSWIISVGATYIFSRFFHQTNDILLIISVLVLLFLLYGSVFFLTQFGSITARGFIRKVSLLHIAMIFLLFLVVFAIFRFLPNSTIFAISIFSVFLPAFFEEISKHFSFLGLLGKKFSFSLADLSIFAFCVVLGFVFVENILYFIQFGPSISLALSRTIFAFATHLLSVLVVVLAWWKSLSYPLFSIKYFFFFVSGLLFSSLLHFFYNYSLSAGNFVLLLPYAFSAYGLFVYLIRK